MPFHRSLAGVAPLAAALTFTAAPADAASGPPVRDAACQRAVAEEPSRATLQAFGVPDSTPWSAKRGGALGPILVRRADRRVKLCVVVFADRRSFSFDPRIRLTRGERLINVAVADPWIAWTSEEAGRVTLRRKRLDSARRPWSRALATVPTTVLVTTDGTVVTRTPKAARVVSYPVGGQARTLRGVAAASRRTPAGRLVLWGTKHVAVVASSIAQPFFPASGRSVTRCTPSARGDRVERTDTATLRIASGTTWAPQSTSSRFELTLCARDGRRLLTRLLHDDGDLYNDVALGVALTGPLLTINASLVANDGGGTSVETADRRYVYVRTSPTTVTRRQVSIVVAAPAAGAFVEKGRLWISDANGLRPVPFAGSLTRSNTRLDLRGSTLLVRTPDRLQTIPLEPLPPGTFASPTISTRRTIPLASADLCGTFSSALGDGCGPPPSAIDQPDA